MSTENNTSPQVWRVVVACNEVQPHTHTREVNVCRNHLGWFTSETTSLGLATSHAAVMEHVHEKRWPVVEIVAPGQPTRAELEAEVARLKQEVVYADRARRERHGMFSDLCADVTLLARDLGLLGADEEAPADRDPLRNFMRHVQDTVRDQRSKVGDLEARNTDLTKDLVAALGDEEDRMDKSELIGFLHVCQARAKALRDMLDAILAADPVEFRRRADKHGQDLEHEDRYRLNGITSALTSGEKLPTLPVHESEGVDA
jgi:hypothetical protein